MDILPPNGVHQSKENKAAKVRRPKLEQCTLVAGSTMVHVTLLCRASDKNENRNRSIYLITEEPIFKARKIVYLHFKLYMPDSESKRSVKLRRQALIKSSLPLEPPLPLVQ